MFDSYRIFTGFSLKFFDKRINNIARVIFTYLNAIIVP